MSTQQEFKLPSWSIDNLPTEDDLDSMVKGNQIVDFADFLRRNCKINYRELLDTARKLQSIDQKVLEEATRYFNPEIEDSCSSEDQNIDQAIHEIQQIPGEPYEKSKKHWWTIEEDGKLKLLVEEYGAKNWKRIAGFF